jgi:hypothetical protein
MFIPRCIVFVAPVRESGQWLEFCHLFPSGNAVPRLTAPLLRRRVVGSMVLWAHMRGGSPIRGLHDRRG